jgi:signal transduction histidine kinase
MVGDSVRPIAAERGVDFAVEIGRDVPPTFIGDPDRLNQVVLNLLDNAFKFTPRGGRIRLAGACENSTIVIEVRDSGGGIAPEQLGAIFQKYARARSSDGGGRGGTGLGLAIARGIVLAHGGMIEAWSKTGEGSTFRVRLPLAGNPARGKEVA